MHRRTTPGGTRNTTNYDNIHDDDNAQDDNQQHATTTNNTRQQPTTHTTTSNNAHDDNQQHATTINNTRHQPTTHTTTSNNTRNHLLPPPRNMEARPTMYRNNTSSDESELANDLDFEERPTLTTQRSSQTQLKLIISRSPYVFAHGFLFVFMIGYLSIGAALFHHFQPEWHEVDDASCDYVVRNTTYLDAFYWATVTLTTVGYGDISPTTQGARVFASIFFIVSVVLVGAIMDLMDTIMSYDNKNEASPKTKKRVKLFWVFEIDNNVAHLVNSVVLLMAILLVGVVVFVQVEGIDVPDALYFSLVTVTTVGYGDIVPVTDSGKLFAIFWIGAACLFFFRALGAYLDMLLEKRKKYIRERLKSQRIMLRNLYRNSRRKMIHSHAPTDAIPELEAQDHSVLLSALSEAEFILYTLEHEGKISHKDVDELVERFANREDGQTNNVQVSMRDLSFHISAYQPTV